MGVGGWVGGGESDHKKGFKAQGAFIRGQLHFHGSPTDIGHGSIYGNCQGSVADRGVWGGGMLEK